MISFRNTLTLFLAILFVFSSCTQQAPTNDLSVDQKVLDHEAQPLLVKAVNPPFENFDVPFNDYSVNAVEGKVIKLKNGTVIKVPKNAFVDENGNPIEGDVTIKYREFHDAASIIASGIPMANRDDYGKYMETAGMFEINGEVNGKPINVAPDKTIEVNMASFVQGNDFDFFYLDEAECKWVTKGKTEPVVNQVRVEKEKAIAPVPSKPAEPAKRNKENFVFDLDINYSTFPELKGFKNVVWEYAGSKDAEDPEKNPWVFKTDWTSVELLPMKNDDLSKYVLKLRSGKNTFTTYVKPVLSGNDYEAAMAEFKKLNNIYMKAKEAMKVERERIEQEAELLREFQIADFGIFNWDIWKMPKRIAVKAEFDFDEAIDTDMNKISVFLVSGDNRSVIRYTPKNFNMFSFDPNEENRMLAILPGNKVVVFSKEDFKKLNIESIRKGAANGQSFKFEMKDSGEVISSMDQLRHVIDKLG
ncbi:MAG: hypothetical protein AAF502_20180 [Bacteroidota bacterium]